MKRHLLRPASLVLVSAVLGACKTTPATPTPATIPGTTLTFALRDDAPTTSAWTRGAGTLTVRGLNTTDVTLPGPVIATAAVNATGTGSVKLPGGADGILDKTAPSPKTMLLMVGNLSVCDNTVTESAPDTQALFVTGADFSTSEGGVALAETTFSSDSTSAILTRGIPVFVTKDDTLAGEFKCGSTTASVNLPFKKGWNMVLLTVDYIAKSAAFSLSTGSSLHFAPDSVAYPVF